MQAKKKDKKKNKKQQHEEVGPFFLTQDWILSHLWRCKGLNAQLQSSCCRGVIMDQKMAHVACKPATDGRWETPPSDFLLA